MAQTLLRTVRTVRVIEGIKAIRGSAPGPLVFDVLMKVLFYCIIGLFVITFSCQEVGTALVPDLARDGCLAAHGIDGHETAFDS